MQHTRSQCPACSQVFAGTRAFDAHRVGPYTRKQRRRRCLWLQMPMSAFIRSDFKPRNQQRTVDSAQPVEQALYADGVLSLQVISTFVTLIRAVRIPIS